jgi:hypothetical protein
VILVGFGEKETEFGLQHIDSMFGDIDDIQRLRSILGG